MKTNHVDTFSHLPDGYYFIASPGAPTWCLVYLYMHDDFQGVRHVAFGAQDGGGLMPITDVHSDTIFIPATIHTADTPLKLESLRPNHFVVEPPLHHVPPRIDWGLIALGAGLLAAIGCLLIYCADFITSFVRG